MTTSIIATDAAIVVSFAVLACLLSYRFGVVNLATEGLIALGACTFAVIRYAGNDAPAAVVLTLVGGAAIGTVFGWLIAFRNVNQIVGGLVMTTVLAASASIAALTLTGTRRIALNSHISLAEFGTDRTMWCIALVISYVVVRRVFVHPVALPLATAVASNIDACVIADVPWRVYRLLACCASGLIASAAGVYLALMSGGFEPAFGSLGYGFVSLALVISTRGNVAWGLVVAILFGCLRIVPLWNSDRTVAFLPLQLAEAVPYLAVLVFCFVADLSKRVREAEA